MIFQLIKLIKGMRINAAEMNVMSIENLKTTGSTFWPFSLRRLKNAISCSEKRFIPPPDE
jgi:hypothetical protein